MTLLAAWVGVDSKENGPSVCSLYIAADSRLTWDRGTKYDLGTKIFGMKNHPDIFGFCGDVLFPTIILKQLADEGDANILFSSGASTEEKFSIIRARIGNAITTYPKAQTTGSFVILYGTRDENKNFHCYKLTCNSINGFGTGDGNLTLPAYSFVIAAEGSGAKEFMDRFTFEYDLSKENNYRTSRAVYHCFTETLDNIKDPACGGAPQIVGLYRVKNARFFGIIRKAQRFFMGQSVPYSENLKFVEWRNDLFERCDPENIQILRPPNGSQGHKKQLPFSPLIE